MHFFNFVYILSSPQTIEDKLAGRWPQESLRVISNVLMELTRSSACPAGLTLDLACNIIGCVPDILQKQVRPPPTCVIVCLDATLQQAKLFFGHWRAHLSATIPVRKYSQSAVPPAPSWYRPPI